MTNNPFVTTMVLKSGLMEDSQYAPRQMLSSTMMGVTFRRLKCPHSLCCSRRVAVASHSIPLFSRLPLNNIYQTRWPVSLEEDKQRLRALTLCSQVRDGFMMCV
jgi:hypothetical protein